MKEYSIALVGLGNVGKAFVQLIERKQNYLAEKSGISFKITGVATGRHGMAINPDGIDLQKILTTDMLNELSTVEQPASVLDFIRKVPADILLENSPVNHDTGEPAVSHLRAALEWGMHAITANKGPVAHAYRELDALATEKGKRFLFESTVMDGAPILSLFRGPLPAAELRGFYGILNSCTNLLLELQEKEWPFEKAVDYARSVGITETDPTDDIDGWDAAIKLTVLANVLLEEPIKLHEVSRQGIRNITPQMIQEALAAGERWKLVCRAEYVDGRLVGRVAPERVGPTSPLYSINGTSSYVEFYTDVLPGLGIVESDPGPETTAYGLLADCINALRGW